MYKKLGGFWKEYMERKNKDSRQYKLNHMGGKENIWIFGKGSIYITGRKEGRKGSILKEGRTGYIGKKREKKRIRSQGKTKLATTVRATPTISDLRKYPLDANREGSCGPGRKRVVQERFRGAFAVIFKALNNHLVVHSNSPWDLTFVRSLSQR